MTEDLTNIYDIRHPSPPSLIQLSSISVALELWRYEINKHRGSNTLHKLILKKKISSGVLKPLVPSIVFNDINEWTETIGKSIDDWLEHGCEAILDFHRDDPNEILRDFDDFVCDFDGRIHLSGTAKRMMLCDRFSIDEKFKIACVHCLEDDVVRIWPSLSKKLSLDDVDFHKHPILFYWICRLTNQLHKIPRSSFDADDDSPEVKMLKCFHTLGWTTAEYFWDRLNPNDRWKSAVNLAESDKLMFGRHVLAKLNEHELNKVMSDGDGDVLLLAFLSSKIVWIILPTWRFIKHKLGTNSILKIAEIILRMETKDCSISVWDGSVSSEIWRSIPDNMKQHVIQKLLPDSSLFVLNSRRTTIFRVVSFLLEVLSDAPSTVRGTFWRYNWDNLIIGCRTTDLSSLMTICFNDEDEIMQFKKSTLSKYRNINPQCSRLLTAGYFDELKDFINFCCPMEEARSIVKQNLLMCNLHLNFSIIIHHAESFDEFVKDAFNNNVEEIDNFKIKLVSSFDKIEIVNRILFHGQYRSMMNFFDRFVVSRETPVYLSKRYFPLVFKNILGRCPLPLVIEGNDLSEFMQWCFENNERDIASFKKTLIMDELIPKIIRLEVFIGPSDSNFRSKRRNVSIDRSCMIDKLDKLLEWYFDTPQDVENFKAKWAYVFEQLF